MKDGKLTSYSTKDGLSSNIVNSLYEDREGSIWIGTNGGGISRFKDGKFTTYKTGDGLPDNYVLALYEDGEASLWIGTNNGRLSRFHDGRFYSRAVEGLKPYTPIRSLYRDRDQVLWAGTGDGLFALKDGAAIRYTTKDGLFSNMVFRLYQDPSGTLWIGTSKGLNRYKNGKLISDKIGDESSASSVTAFAWDSEGSLWVGFIDYGLTRLHAGPFVTYTADDGLNDSFIHTVLQTDKNTLWIGTSNGLSSLHNGKFTSYPANQGFPNKNILSLEQDSKRHLWVGVEGSVYRSQSPVDCAGNQCVPHFVALPNLIPGVYPRAIVEDRSGAIWIGTNLNGVIRYDGKTTKIFTTADGLASNSVKTLIEDREGNLWIGTRVGLVRYKDGVFTTYTEKDGLVKNGIEGLYADAENTLWIATRNGVSRFKNGKFTNYTENDGLYFSFVHHIIEDDRHYLWMSCSKGIFRVSKEQMNEFADGKIKSVTSYAYGLEDGLRSSVASAGYNPGIYKTDDGKIWFATANGLSVVDPQKLSSNTLAPAVHIYDVNIDQRGFDSNRVAEVPPGRGDLAFHYAGLSFLAPEKVKFKYKLEGYDKDWVDAGGRRAAYYSNIPPGWYTFRVIASNDDGVWNQTGTFYTFYLRPHFYQTYWFYALCGVTALLLLWGISRIKARRLERRERELVAVNEALAGRLKAEAQYYELFESAVYGIYRARNGRYLEVNRAMMTLLGYDSANEVLALDPATQVYFDRTEFIKLQAELEKSGRVEGITATWRRKDGKPILVRLSGRRVPSLESGADTVEVIAEDISKEKHLEEQLRQSQKMEAIGRLAGGVAHDFNNLLTIIKGCSELLLQETELPDGKRGTMEEIRKAAERGASLTQQLLAFSRRQVLAPRILDLNVVLRNTEKLLRRLLGEDVELVTDYDPILGRVKADLNQIEQVVLNLCVNSRDAMPHGGKLSLTTRNVSIQGESGAQDGMPPGEYVLIEVRDTGHGMDTETLAHIFEPFFTTKEVGRGTGLGLSTVYGIVEHSGGHIDVESVAGKGTTFRIYLPHTAQVEQADTYAVPPKDLRGSETILVVEDEPALRELTASILRKNGYTVIEASTAVEALQIYQEPAQCIDLVLTDVVMPGMTGTELAKQLRKYKPGMGLMFISGYIDNPTVQEDMLIHNLPFLQKPYGPTELLSKVREALNLHAADLSRKSA